MLVQFNTRHKNRQCFCAEFVTSIPKQTKLKYYARVASDPHACQWQCPLQNRPTSYQQADPPVTTTLIPRNNRKKKSRLGYAKYVRTEKDTHQLLVTTLSFLKAYLNQAGRQTSLSVVNNPYDRITSADKHVLKESPVLAASTGRKYKTRALSPTNTYTPSSTHAQTQTQEESLKIILLRISH